MTLTTFQVIPRRFTCLNFQHKHKNWLTPNRKYVRYATYSAVFHVQNIIFFVFQLCKLTSTQSLFLSTTWRWCFNLVFKAKSFRQILFCILSVCDQLISFKALICITQLCVSFELLCIQNSSLIRYFISNKYHTTLSLHSLS